MVPEDQIGAGREGGLCHGLLVIGDQARHEVDAPVQGEYDDIGALFRATHIQNKIGQILLVRRGDHAGRHAGLIVEPLVVGVGAQRRDTRLVRSCRVALAQDRAIGEQRDPQPVAVEDRRPARLVEVAAAAGGLDAHAAQ